MTASGSAAMRSPVNWAILGLVIERPSYGYELAQRFEHAYGEVLPISGVSHVYAALDGLRRRSMIEEVPSAAADTGVRRLPRPHYRATAHGMRSYQGRLADQMREDHRRSRLFVRQLAVFCDEPAAALELLDTYERACLEEAAKTPVGSGDGSLLDREREFLARLTSEESRLTTGAKLEWVEYARREFGAVAERRTLQQ